MAAQDDVHELVKSMSKPEKRYFKLYSGFHGRKNNNYTKLFDAYDKLEAYDEKALRASLKGESFTAHLASVKHRLYRLILDSLLAFNNSKLQAADIRNLIDHSRLLISRGLHKQARKTLAKARSKAEGTEHYPALMEISTFERNLLFGSDYKIKLEDVERHYDRCRDIITGSSELFESWEFQDRVFLVVARYHTLRTPEARKMLGKYAERQGQSGAGEAISLFARLNTLSAEASIAMLGDRYSDAKGIYGSMIELWDSKPVLRDSKPLLYTYTLSSYLICARALRRFEEFPSILSKLKDCIPHTIEDKLYRIEHVLWSELTYQLNSYDLDAACTTAKEILDAVDEYKQKLHPRRAVEARFHCAIAYFFAGRHNDALEQIDSIIQAEATASLPDFYAISIVFRLVNYYEAGNFAGLEARLRSTRRTLKANGILLDFETSALKNLRNLMDADTASARNAVFLEFKRELVQLLHRDGETSPICLDTILMWVESRLKKKSTVDILRFVNSHSSDDPLKEAFPA